MRAIDECGGVAADGITEQSHSVCSVEHRVRVCSLWYARCSVALLW
jgi:hypothetical protein